MGLLVSQEAQTETGQRRREDHPIAQAEAHDRGKVLHKVEAEVVRRFVGIEQGAQFQKLQPHPTPEAIWVGSHGCADQRERPPMSFIENRTYFAREYQEIRTRVARVAKNKHFRKTVGAGE